MWDSFIPYVLGILLVSVMVYGLVKWAAARRAERRHDTAAMTTALQAERDGLAPSALEPGSAKEVARRRARPVRG